MIPFIKPYYDEEDLAEIEKVLKSGWVAQGPKCEEFEQAVINYLGCFEAISVTNCTAALYLALSALGITDGDEVIIPDFTFPATGLAVLNTGATPILVDVNDETYNVTASAIGKAITEKTKAIIPVHLFGRACYMQPIMELAAKYRLHVIEDAACSLGTVTDMGMAGTVGDIGCFSLQASKGITTGEGGLCVTNDPVLAERMRRLSCFGDERTVRRNKSKSCVPFKYSPEAFNFKMSDITAALALSQLRKINKFIEARIYQACQWHAILKSDPFARKYLRAPELYLDHRHIYQSYVCRVVGMSRRKITGFFKEKGFMTGIGTHACHVYPEAFPGYKDKDLPVSSRLYETAISLPRYYGLDVIDAWYNGGK